MGSSESKLKFSNEEFSRSISTGTILMASPLLIHWWFSTMGLAQLEWNSTFCTVERGGCGCFWSQSVSGSWTESHLCFVAHLHLQRAVWVGMLIRCVHLRTNPLEYYDNIWQTSSPEWQGWPTASEHYCLSRKHRSFDVLHMTNLRTKYPVEGSWVLYLLLKHYPASGLESQVLDVQWIFSQHTTIFFF